MNKQHLILHRKVNITIDPTTNPTNNLHNNLHILLPYITHKIDHQNTPYNSFKQTIPLQFY